MRFKDAVTQLEYGLARELPGAAAQARLAPKPRRQWPAGFDSSRIRDAAGLLLVFPRTINAEHAEHAEHAKESQALRAQRALRSMYSDTAHILLTVRADTLGRHGGQV